MSYFTKKFCYCCFLKCPLYSERKNIQIIPCMATIAKLVFQGSPAEMYNPRCLHVFHNHFIWYCHTLIHVVFIVRSYEIVLHSPLPSESMSLVGQLASQFNQENLLSAQFVLGTGPRMNKMQDLPSAYSQHIRTTGQIQRWLLRKTQLDLWRREAQGRLLKRKGSTKAFKG